MWMKNLSKFSVRLISSLSSKGGTVEEEHHAFGDER